jgi:hypothetical protein
MSDSQNYSGPNFVIPYTVPSNIPPSLFPFLKPIYIGFQNIIQTLITYGGIAPRNPGSILTSNNDPTAILANNTHRFYTQATETIFQGAAINLVSVLGTLQVQNANATDGTKPCDGFCSQSGGIPAGGVGEVILNDGVNNALTGLSVGTRYFLATSSGGYTSLSPSGPGTLSQELGIAITTTSLRFWTGMKIQN